MGEYVELPGVRTWYEVHGSGEPLLMLHPGLSTIDPMDMQRAVLAARYRVYLPERRAHGHTPDVEGPLSLHDMADDTIAFIESQIQGPAHMVGWSDGANIALMVAAVRPDLVGKVVAIGANCRPVPEVGAEPTMLDHLSADDPALEMFRSLYAAASPDGPEHWPIVVDKLLAMWRSEPDLSDEDLGRIRARTLIMVGDDDQIALEHTISVFRAIRQGELAVVPGASHAAPLEKPELVNGIVLDFLVHDPVPTMAPIRRARAVT